MSRPLPANDDFSLHQLLRLEENDPLPQAVVDLYWRFKFVKDRFMCCDTHCDVLALICVLAGEQAPAPPAANPLHTRIQRKEMQVEELIGVRWRGGHPRAAKYLDYSPQRNEVQVCFIDESTERWIAMEKIMEAPEAELVEA